MKSTLLPFLCNMRSLIILLSILVLSGSASSQLRLVSYNLLNFPTGNIQGRTDTLENILEYLRPHLLMIQELKTETGLSDITDMMNGLGYGDFAHSEFIEQQSPGSPGNLLQQAIVYDTQYLRMKSESVVLTEYRDINEYILYLNDPQLVAGADTVFLHVYVTHLKSSEGTDNESSRLNMVNALIAHFESLPANSNVIFAGDFNLYSNTEPAYMALMNSDNAIVMNDIFGTYGDWSGFDFAHKEILTQSTRSAQIFNDGAGGGVDDRFDFILFSETLLDPDAGLHYLQDSYLSVGNNGMCYNESITSCAANNSVPADVLQSIYYMSDHIPQFCMLESPLISRVLNAARPEAQIFLPSGNIFRDIIDLRFEGIQSRGRLIVCDLSGQIVYDDIVSASMTMNLNSSSWAAGTYLVHLSGPDISPVHAKIVILR